VSASRFFFLRFSAPILLFDRAASILPPGPWDKPRRRADVVKAGRRSDIEASSAIARPRLDDIEHGGRLARNGMRQIMTILVDL